MKEGTQQLTLQVLVAQLIDSGFLGVTEDGRFTIDGQVYEAENDNTVDTSAPFDENGFSQPNPFGARMLEGVEAYRKELERTHPELAKKLPQWYMVPPAAMENAADAAAWREAHPDWDEQQIWTASENCRWSTLPGYSRMIRVAFTISNDNRGHRRRGEKLPNTRACGIGFADDAGSEADMHNIIANEMVRRFEQQKNPDPWWG